MLLGGSVLNTGAGAFLNSSVSPPDASIPRGIPAFDARFLSWDTPFATVGYPIPRTEKQGNSDIFRSAALYGTALLALGLLFCLATSHRSDIPSSVQLITPSGKSMEVMLPATAGDLRRGLSGIKEDELSPKVGALFLYPEERFRYFWMLDTYFPLDIYFLDSNFSIIEVERNMPPYPGRENPRNIPRTRTVFSRHVLEIKSRSVFNEELTKGVRLRWGAEIIPAELEATIYPQSIFQRCLSFWPFR